MATSALPMNTLKVKWLQVSCMHFFVYHSHVFEHITFTGRVGRIRTFSHLRICGGLCLQTPVKYGWESDILADIRWLGSYFNIFCNQYERKTLWIFWYLRRTNTQETHGPHTLLTCYHFKAMINKHWHIGYTCRSLLSPPYWVWSYFHKLSMHSHCHYYFSLKKVGVLHLNKLEFSSLNETLCQVRLKLALWIRKRFLKVGKVIHYFTIIYREKVHGLLIKKTWFSFIQECVLPSLVDIDRVVVEKKMKI